MRALSAAQERLLRACTRAGTGSYGLDTWFRSKHAKTVAVLERLALVSAERFPDGGGRMWITPLGRVSLKR